MDGRFDASQIDAEQSPTAQFHECFPVEHRDLEPGCRAQLQCHFTEAGGRENAPGRPCQVPRELGSQYEMATTLCSGTGLIGNCRSGDERQGGEAGANVLSNTVHIAGQNNPLDRCRRGVVDGDVHLREGEGNGLHLRHGAREYRCCITNSVGIDVLDIPSAHQHRAGRSVTHHRQGLAHGSDETEFRQPS